MSLASEQNIFSIVTLVFCLLGFAHFILLASNDVQGESAHASDWLLRKRMGMGMIPPSIDLFLYLPVLCVPLGVRVGFAKRASAVLFVLFSILVRQMVRVVGLTCQLENCHAQETSNRFLQLRLDVIAALVFFCV